MANFTLHVQVWDDQSDIHDSGPLAAAEEAHALFASHVTKMVTEALTGRTSGNVDLMLQFPERCVPMMQFYLGFPRFCRECGCTEQDACVINFVPCHWVEDNLCSACVPPSQEVLIA